MSKVKEYYLEEEYNPIEAIDKLQQENTKLRIQISAREEEYIKLQEENTKLKELCDKYEEEHNTEFKIWKDERYQLLDYKSRNEKAIKFIEQKFLPSHSIKNTDWEFEEVIYSDLPVGAIKPLVDILKGSK